MDRNVMAVCFLVLIGYLLPKQLQAKPLIEIVDLKWCSGIAVSDDPEKGREPIGVYKNSSLFRGSKLYLWMKIKGYQGALDRLRQGKKIDIIQLWNYRYFGRRTEPIDDVSIGKKRLNKETIKKLQQEIDQRGYFDWRTWAIKENLIAKEYDVDFVDAFYAPLRCSLPFSCKMHLQIR